jgi:tetratricopeptide (TPR) repeat protein
MGHSMAEHRGEEAGQCGSEVGRIDDAHSIRIHAAKLARRWGFALAVIASAPLVVPPHAWAAKASAKGSAGDELAREATRRFKEGEHDLAAQLFMKAYALDKRPDRVFNAARAYEKADKPQEAVALFRLYRQITDDEAGRQEAQLRIEALEAQARAKAAAATTPPAPAEPAEAPVAPPADPSPSTAAPAGPPVGVSQRAKPPAPSRLPAALALGGGGLLALASAGLYGWVRQDEAELERALQQRDTAGRVSGISQADAEDARLRQGSLRTWSAVGAGAAAAALLVGVWWWRAGTAEVQVSPEGAGLALRF